MQFSIPSLNGGEISDLLAGRIDFKNRGLAGREVTNFIPLIQGPIVSRPGTRYISTVYNSAKKAHLIGFKSASLSSYVIEMSEYVFRFYNDGARLEGGNKNLVSATNANPCVFTVTGHGYTKNDILTVSGGTGNWAAVNGDWVVKAVTTNTFQLRSIDGNVDVDTGSINSTTYGAVAGSIVFKWIGKQHHYAESKIFDSAGRFDICTAKLGDTIFFAQKDFWPTKLTVNSNTAWTYGYHYHNTRTVGSTVYPYFEDGPWLDQNATDTQLDFGSSGGLVANGQTGNITANDNIFASTDPGRLIRNDTQNPGYFIIDTYSSATQVAVQCKEGNDGGLNKTAWRLGHYSATTGFPRKVTFFQNRIVYARSNNYPTRIDLSRTSNYSSFRITGTNNIDTIDDSHGVTFSLAADDTGGIQWMIPTSNALVVGTDGDVFSVSGSESSIITPGQVTANAVSSFGCENIPPVKIGDEIIFSEKLGMRLRTAAYSSVTEGMDSVDVNKLAPHIFFSSTSGQSGIIAMAYASSPFSTLWCVRKDGRVVSLTYSKGENIAAFATHKIGGTFSSGDAVVESVCTVPSDDFHDEVWLTVKRTINSATVRYVERMDDSLFINPAISQSLALTMDSAYTYNSTPATVISGLSHLNGEAVDVVADGVIITGHTVSGGQITLSTAASIVNVGLAFRPVFESTNIEAGNEQQSTLGSKKRINLADVGFYKSLGGKVGRSSSYLESVDWGSYTTSAVSLFSGVKKVAFNGDHTDIPRFRYEQTIPAPVCITFLNLEGDTYG